MQDFNFSNFKIVQDDRDVVTVWIDVADRPMNVFNASVLGELATLVGALEANSKAELVVFRSAKSNAFFAGADLKEIGNFTSSPQLETVVRRGQDLFRRVSQLRMPTIAVIHGPCLGGGLEFALACRYRIAVDSGSTRLGLPEVQLGIIPAWGGCQRLPARVGLMQALPMVLTGRKLTADKAYSVGLVDAVCPETDQEPCIEKFIVDVLKNPRRPNHNPRPSLWKRFADNTTLGRWVVFNRANKQTARDAMNYPALPAAIRAIRDGYRSDVDGFETERREFAKLVETPTCRNLMGLFFRREKARDLKTWHADGASADVGKIETVAVIGAGAMGAGIGQLAALKGYTVVLKELNDELAEAGRKRITKLFDDMVSRGRLPMAERDENLSRITVTSSFSELNDADLVIEAVVERADVKHAVFKELDGLLKPSAMIVSNTSALSVSDMAAVTGRPDKVGGLHFFNPVYRMELVEVVRANDTSNETMARLAAFVKRVGKTPIVTSDSPGFLVNRVLFPYIGEAVRMVTEGHSPSTIDRELKRFGMPMGPIELLDHVGIDVALHVSGTLESVLPDTAALASLLQSMVDRGWTGTKGGRGFYRYENGRRGDAIPLSEILPNDSNVRSEATPGQVDCVDDGLTDIQRRVVYPLINEAFRCLQEGVVAEPWMADLAMVLGTGFAPFRGGPVSVAEHIGHDKVVDNLKRMQSELGQRFEPSKRLVEAAEGGQKTNSHDSERRTEASAGV